MTSLINRGYHRVQTDWRYQELLSANQSKKETRMKVRWAKTFGLELVPFIFGAIFVTAFTERPLIGVAILLMAITSIGYNSYRIVDRIDGAEQRIIELEDDLDEAERRAEELEEEIEEAKSLAWIL